MKTARTSFIRLKGFTLIELLVVLGILGILATALVATIDPFEQLKKANDSNVKNAAVELINASLRYYTTHNDMPWGTAGVTNCGTAGVISGAVIASGNGLNCVNGLITDGELKDEFTAATSITASVYVTGDTTQPSNHATACYQPQSKSQQRDANTIYTSAAGSTTNNTTCKAKGGNANCYWCATL
jgi:prepilin-type N-terminal cleavage/methylation domain-containing protein